MGITTPALALRVIPGFPDECRWAPMAAVDIAIRPVSWVDDSSLCTHGREQYGKPIARVVPVEKGSPENLLLEIGMVLKEAGVSREEALRALKAAGKVVYD
jgi:hypothetical protein